MDLNLFNEYNATFYFVTVSARYEGLSNSNGKCSLNRTFPFISNIEIFKALKYHQVAYMCHDKKQSSIVQ